jgi:hypothetical protein
LKYFYLAAFDGDEKLNYRLRLCEQCAQSMVMDLISVADRRDKDGIWRGAEWWS